MLLSAGLSRITYLLDNLSSRCEGKTSSGEPDKRESTDAGHRGGSARSSGEVSVMGMERRGRRILDGPEVNWKRDEPRGQMEGCYASQEVTASWNTKNRMLGDYQVRFRERLGVKFPRPGLLDPRFAPWNPIGARVSFRSHSLSPLNHIAARQCSPQRRWLHPLGAIFWPSSSSGHAWASCRRAPLLLSYGISRMFLILLTYSSTM